MSHDTLRVTAPRLIGKQIGRGFLLLTQPGLSFESYMSTQASARNFMIARRRCKGFAVKIE